MNISTGGYRTYNRGTLTLINIRTEKTEHTPYKNIQEQSTNMHSTCQDKTKWKKQ